MPVTERKRANRLDGRSWLKNSISVWSDIEKSHEERQLRHPAMFPAELVERLIDCYAPPDAHLVIDPFLGSGSTLIGAKRKGLSAVGFEVVEKFARMAHARITKAAADLLSETSEINIVLMTPTDTVRVKSEGLQFIIVVGDVRRTSRFFEDGIADILITSPPYWNIHRRQRSVDRKDSRPYSEKDEDLGNIANYGAFLRELQKIFSEMKRLLKSGAYAIVDVMDLRYGPRFIPFHMDITQVMGSAGFVIEDIIIWNRAREYNNLRPIGYPYKFIVNKVHEYLLVFRRDGAYQRPA